MHSPPAAHSLAYYRDKVARPALILAQRDAERGGLEGCGRKTLHQTVEALFANIALTQTARFNPSRSDRPFSNMVRTCLRLVGRPHADAAIHLIKELDRRRRMLRAGAEITSAAKLPVLHKSQLASTWRPGTLLVAIRFQSELDKAAAAILAALAEMHGIPARTEPAGAPKANLAEFATFQAQSLSVFAAWT
jgi:hypothetical protein